MPPVPYRVSPDVSPQGGAQPFTGLQVSAEDTGAVTAAGFQRLGVGLVRAADVFNDIAAQDMSNQFEDRATKLLYGDPDKMVTGPDGEAVPDRGYFGKVGADALSARGTTEQALQDLEREISGKVLNGDQRKAFTKFANSYRMQARARISNYADTQATTYGEQVNRATSKLELDKIAAFPDDGNTVNEANERLRRAYVRTAQLKGGGPELINEALRAADRDTVKAQIASIAPHDPDKALRIAENSKSVLGVEYDNIYRTLKTPADAQFARNYVSGLISGGGGPVPAGSDAKAMLRHFEGFRTGTYWDVNAHRTGYGSDTITRADGTVVPVKEGMTVTKEDAERDLERRAALSQGQVKTAAGPAWNKLSEGARASLTSVAYNYGRVPEQIVAAIRSGDDAEISKAIMGLAGHNNGVNAGRRKIEADFVMRGGRAASTASPTEAGLIETINNDPVFRNRPEAKEMALAQATRMVSAINADRSAQLKSLNDSVDATVQVMMLSPDTYKDGTLLQLAERYKTLGDQSAYVTTLFLAQNEQQIKTLATSPRSAQNAIIAKMLPGKSQALGEGFIAATKEEAAEAKRLAQTEFAAIKEAVDGKSPIPVEALSKKIKDTIGLAVRSGDPLLASQIADYVDAVKGSQALGNLPPVMQEKIIGEIREQVIKGRQSNADLQRLDFMTKLVDTQDTAFKDDPLAAASKWYAAVGPLQPIRWDGTGQQLAEDLAARSRQSDVASANRDGAPVPIVTNAEMDRFRNMLTTSSPAKQEMMFRALSGMPDSKKAQFAVMLAGRNGTGDYLSNSYAASLSLFSSPDPEDQAAASKILKGAAIRKNLVMKAPPVDDSEWQLALQEKFGNVFKEQIGGVVPRAVADAIASVYTHDMFVAGKQAQKAPDLDVLSRAIRQVVGDPLVLNGQKFFPPKRGMTDDDVDHALRSLTDADVSGLRTLEGQPVTADRIRRFGQFSNIQDGRYMVRIPDGRSGVPSEIVDYSKNPPGAYILDMRPLVDRAKQRVETDAVMMAP